MINILSVPDEILDKVLSYFTYDEVSRLRMVCKQFDSSAQRVLNRGFYEVERFHNRCLKKVKEQLPRRESERRKHHLSAHCDVLTAIETRLSLLGMTFMKYVELKCCCFIPGKVLDEMFSILRLVSTVSVPPRTHELLQELRDISSMAMEHFDEKIAPAFKSKGNVPKISITTYGVVGGSSRNSAPSVSCIRSTGYSYELIKLHMANRQNHSKFLEIKRENAELKRKSIEFRRKLNEQNQRIVEMDNITAEQNSRMTDQEGKIAELNRKLVEYDRCLGEVLNSMMQFKEEKRLLQAPISKHLSNVVEENEVQSRSTREASGNFVQPTRKRKPVEPKRRSKRTRGTSEMG